MKNWILLSMLFMNAGAAQAYVGINLNEACDPDLGIPKPLENFCKTPKEKRNWSLGIYFGPFIANYLETVVHLKRGDQITSIGEVQPEQRTSFSYYKVTQNDNPAQMFDEPQNRIGLAYRSNKHRFEVGIEYVHPKIIILPDDEKDVHNLGTTIDPVYLDAIQTTKLNIMMNLYALKRFELSKPQHRVRFAYSGGVGIGIHGSSSVFAYEDQHGNHTQDPEAWKTHGIAYSLQNRMDINVGHSRFNARFGHDFVLIHYDTQQGDTHLGTNLLGQFFSMQLGFQLVRGTSEQ